MRLFILCIIVLASCNTSKKTKQPPQEVAKAPTVVDINGLLQVKGNRIVNSKGEVVSFAGNSFFWSNDYYRGNGFYNKEVVKWLKDDWNATIIRIPMAADKTIQDSYIFNKKDNLDKVTTLIDAAIELGLYVIVDWHSHSAEDNEADAIAFFEGIAKTYGHHPNIIYEIYNEPLRVSWDDVIKPYAERVIAAIRKIDPDNIIVVGTSHWSQGVDDSSENPIAGFNNIAYTLHFYAGSHKQWLMNKAQKALDNGVALIVTEWGTVDADGSGAVDMASTKLWMDFMEANQLTHCNWSINDKEEGASALKLGANKSGNWTDNNLTESGKLVKSYIKNWK